MAIGITKVILGKLNAPFSCESHKYWLSAITYYLSARVLQVKKDKEL
jgi:hypothetical protein